MFLYEVHTKNSVCESMEAKTDPIITAVAATDAIMASTTTIRKEPMTKNVQRSHYLKFHDTFGRFGIAMIAIFLLSTVWSIILAVIQVEPAVMANKIMNTTHYDQGEFWLLPLTDKYIDILAVIALLLFAIGYLALVLLMIFPNQLYPVKIRQGSEKVNYKTTSKFSVGEATLDAIRLKVLAKAPVGFSFARLKHELFSPQGLLRHYIVSS